LDFDSLKGLENWYDLVWKDGMKRSFIEWRLIRGSGLWWRIRMSHWCGLILNIWRSGFGSCHFFAKTEYGFFEEKEKVGRLERDMIKSELVVDLQTKRCTNGNNERKMLAILCENMKNYKVK